MKLILNDTADEADGRALAKAHLQSKAAHPKELDERERLVQQLVDQLLSEPRIVDRLLGYGDRLREELREAPETAAGATPGPLRFARRRSRMLMALLTSTLPVGAAHTAG